MYLAIPHGDWLALPLLIALASAAGLLFGRWRALAIVAGLLGFVVPFIIAPEHTFVRFFTATLSVVVIFRVLDLWTDAREWDAGRRIFHMIAVYDSRRAVWGRPAPDRAALARLALFLPLSVIGAFGSSRFGADQPLGGLVARWLFAALFTYAGLEVLASSVRAAARAIGITPPPIHDDPIKSRTVAEFWGRRWNIVVRDILFEHCFRPLVRIRRPRLGALAAFAMSGLFHFWVTYVALGAFWGLVMAGFFAVQGALVLLENALRVARWPRAFQHAWTVCCILGTSPLITEPLLLVWLR